ncbi:sugar-specific transcriptional regulator TrmB [Anaerobacterium chartisolvens]|uniref:Sugar-specific transcriptional regulator TrmB n=1 Tax=Anaerobacterium chartisolvens TaxID=1297424 RepID=A0A369BAF1_9FIRM|nr:TrmB family transcriptional regulator [Anaerobacterium chartisolvens]RCX18381.1 sugar-specific transcriptional regulator TrmB [Anaerobacterium chartisolvens]
MDIIDLLIQFNLTRQEASIYLTLLSEGDMNGYEVAKVTGISRSNTYTSLASLVDKGGAFTIEGPTTRYTPVPIEEFCENKIRNLQEKKQDIIKSIPHKRDEIEGYITIKGRSHILDKMRNMVKEAKERVYLSISETALQCILPEIRNAINRGIKMVLITNMSFSLEGATAYFTEKPQQQIRLIVDSTNVLTGDIDDGEHSTCLYSKKKNLIDLLKDSLKNEIRLIEMMKGENRT